MDRPEPNVLYTGYKERALHRSPCPSISAKVTCAGADVHSSHAMLHDRWGLCNWPFFSRKAGWNLTLSGLHNSSVSWRLKKKTSQQHPPFSFLLVTSAKSKAQWREKICHSYAVKSIALGWWKILIRDLLREEGCRFAAEWDAIPEWQRYCNCVLWPGRCCRGPFSIVCVSSLPGGAEAPIYLMVGEAFPGRVRKTWKGRWPWWLCPAPDRKPSPCRWWTAWCQTRAQQHQRPTAGSQRSSPHSGNHILCRLISKHGTVSMVRFWGDITDNDAILTVFTCTWGSSRFWLYSENSVYINREIYGYSYLHYIYICIHVHVLLKLCVPAESTTASPTFIPKSLEIKKT